ncbi:hypothetical protein KI387_007272, partial [Taxus chinensis]
FLKPSQARLGSSRVITCAVVGIEQLPSKMGLHNGHDMVDILSEALPFIQKFQ